MEEPDYCDFCPGEAKVATVSVVTLTNGGKLTLCGHCTDFRRAALEAKGATILDDRDVA